jgi:hypothetical protein
MEISQLISYLFHSRTQTHIFHLQTTSFAEHMALNAYYDGIVPLIDGLVESYQGKYGIVTGYSNYKLLEYKGNDQTIAYLEQLCSVVDQTFNSIEDTYIQNQLDTITELIKSTIYKLKNLN